MRLPVNQALPLAALVILSGCGLGGGHRPALSPPPKIAASGPAADYPVVMGDPFTIDGKTWTPHDKLNYDAVGGSVIGDEGGEAISAAHKLLPLPSYAEVTALDTGRTILVRIERRGPMRNDAEVELSPGAAAQLGLSALSPAPVRVRRVNPPENERALLRSGQRAPERMETPAPLLRVLMRKLENGGSLAPATVAPPPAAPEPPALAATPTPAPSPAVKPPSKPAPAAKPPKPPAPAPTAVIAGGLLVQAAAFSEKPRADKASAALGGTIVKPGKFWLVRLGPFARKADADAALAKVRAAGYSDARILRAD